MGVPARDNNKPPVALIASLYFGFVLTGIGTNLLGCVLPALSHAWGLSDSHSGFLIAAQFAGSSSGSIFVQSRLYRSLIGGYVVLIISAVLVALCHGYLAPVLLFCFGLGLGSSMTSTSMIIASIYRAKRGSVLSSLNAVWGLGAVLCPGLATLWERDHASITIYTGLALAAVLPLIFFVIEFSSLSAVRHETSVLETRGARWSLLIPLAVFAFLYVGVESSVSGWMMTYIGRLLHSGGLYAPIVTSLFWIALLAGRFAAPVVLRRVTETQLLMFCVCALIASNALLLISQTPAMSITSATLSGLMMAPIFPLCLSKVLAITSRPSESKWVFAISGLGGAALPWLTGQIATMRGSLRTGLAVPLIASCIMLLLQLRTQARIERSEVKV
ncbi:sugar MFS transporter [Acidobacterium sp. S8]|uniref:MFS transporter n=1 Tax=Acidobacterium sp. S8 TaxID=1641854 RepID=UPI00131D610D|nr:MFS transporter [Acidobacterium sp. S8]